MSNFIHYTLTAEEQKLAIYPYIHRSHRQSQIVLEDAANINEKLNCVEVVLKPGDVMYIPPFWAHRVESLSFSVSLSIISPSNIHAALMEVYWELVPFGELRSNQIGMHLFF